MRRFRSPAFLYLALVLGVLAYWPGLAGPFLFDDFPNLEPMGHLGGVKDWATFKAFVFGGGAGPSGRPLSLASFLIDDNNWPSIAAPFKYTSLGFHLVCGLLLAWASFLLLRIARFDENRAAWLAVLTASFWLLHPYFVSTTLYVVQRMTILSTLFMLAGMVGYLKGRIWLAQPQRFRARNAYAVMTVSAGLGTLLAVLSKENGALLPLLLLVMEAYLHRMNPESRPNRLWLVLVLGMPALAVLAYLALQINFKPNLWPTRPFDQVERLYSEARIVWDYLGQLWLPRIEGSGLYQDGFVISRSLTQPISTLWAVLAWAATLTLLPFLYKRTPAIWLAICFFLCAHLIESTVLGLELHFEHRNYAPAMFMFLPLALGIDWLGRRTRERTAVSVAVVLLCLLSWMTWQRSHLWADLDRLQTYWALKDPASARGQNYLIGRLMDQGNYAAALALADDALQASPQSPLLSLTRLRLLIYMGRANALEFETTTKKLATQPFDAQAVAGLRVITDSITEMPALAAYRPLMLQTLSTLSKDSAYKDVSVFRRVAAYMQAKLYLAMGDPAQAKAHYIEAMARYGRASSAMQMFAEVARAGHLDEAQTLLDKIRSGVVTGSLSVERLGQEYYLHEISTMQAMLDDDRAQVRAAGIRDEK